MDTIFYPKQINKMHPIIRENQCFFAMPFSEEYDNLYETLETYLKDAGYVCVRVDNNSLGSVPIINLILNGIATSQYIVVDITETNANVFYELGITHTIKDYDSVFIIKEKAAKAPFDINHLQYIEYDKNKLKDFAAKLINRLKSNSYKTSFRRTIISKQIVPTESIDEFINYITSKFDESQVSLYTLLLDNEGKYSGNEQIAIDVILQYSEMLTTATNNSNTLDTYILFKLFIKILLPCSHIYGVKKYIADFLRAKEFGNLKDGTLLQYQTALAIEFAQKSKLLDITVCWIIEYFQRSKSTKVDLNRYQLEAFLLTTKCEAIDKCIAEAIVSDNKYIREHMADIAGEKRLKLAEDNLIIQLNKEKNIFTVSSIVEALGKINSTKSIDHMNRWLNENAEQIITDRNYFVLKHFRNAILKIDCTKALAKFDEKYFTIVSEHTTI